MPLEDGSYSKMKNRFQVKRHVEVFPQVLPRIASSQGLPVQIPISQERGPEASVQHV